MYRLTPHSSKDGLHPTQCHWVLSLILSTLCIVASPLYAEQAAYRPSLDELAATSDLVGVAQVYYTDYKYSHGYATSGTAYLRMLITYRSDHPVETLRVPEKGLHSGECYFPKANYSEDGPRYLVFLSRNAEGDYIGNPHLCKVPIAVTKDNGYAMPYPRPELRIGAIGEAAVMDVEFNDANATVDVSDMTQAFARIRAEELGGELRDQRIIFTQGIPLSTVRQLMGEENLVRERSYR